MKLLLICCLVVFVSGCSGLQLVDNNSKKLSVEGEHNFTAIQAAQVASDTTDFLKKRYPPAQTVFNYHNSNALLGKSLLNALRSAGYGLVSSQTKDSEELKFSADAVGTLRYVSFSVGEIQINRIYRLKPDGTLETGIITEQQLNTLAPAPIKQVAAKPALIKQVAAKPAPIKQVAAKPAPIKQVAAKPAPIKQVAAKPAPIKHDALVLAAKLKLAEIELKTKQIDAQLAAIKHQSVGNNIRPRKVAFSSTRRGSVTTKLVPPKPVRQLVAGRSGKPLIIPVSDRGMLPAPDDNEIHKITQLASQQKNFMTQVQLMAGLNQDDLRKHQKLVEKAGYKASIVQVGRLRALRVKIGRKAVRTVLSTLRKKYNDAYVVGG